MKAVPSHFDVLMRVQEVRDAQGRELFVPWYARSRYGFVVPEGRAATLRRELRTMYRFVFWGGLLAILAILASGVGWAWALPVIAADLLAGGLATRHATRELERVPIDPATAEALRRQAGETPARQLAALLAISVVAVAVSLWLAGQGMRSLGTVGAVFFAACAVVLALRLVRSRPRD
jgi:hypothetical protein